MDLLDKKILFELDNNCRQSCAKIARKTHSSRAVVNYRVSKLEAAGIIRKYVASVNLGKLGYSTFKFYFKLKSGKDKNNLFAKHLCDLPEVIHCVRLVGTYDFAATVAVKSVVELNLFLSGIKNQFYESIKEYRMSIIVHSAIFGRFKFLGQKEGFDVENYSADSADRFIQPNVDAEDKKLLAAISGDASLSLLDLAQKTGLSIDSVKYRLKQLTKKGIISNFRILFDMKSFGFYNYLFLLDFNGSSFEEKSLLTWCKIHKNVIYATKRAGFWDYELNLAIKDIDELNAFVADIESKFSRSLVSYEFMLSVETLKLRYCPF